MTELENLLLKQLQDLQSNFERLLNEHLDATKKENDSLRRQMQQLSQDVENTRAHYVKLLRTLGLDQNLEANGENALAKSLILFDQHLTARETTLRSELAALETRNAQQRRTAEQQRRQGDALTQECQRLQQQQNQLQQALKR